jgi:large subunit ribosomal protein L23
MADNILKKLLKTDDTAPAEKKADEVASTTAAPVEPKNLRSLLVRPLITEKSSLLMSQNQYVFKVRPQANKLTVARAIEEMYSVKPTNVRIINTSIKKRVRGRTVGTVGGWKKAIVTLPEGKSIHVNEGGA